jgi:hypothetical protein
MERTKDPTTGGTNGPAAPRRRFRIEKLEERVAPKKGGNGTNNSCITGKGCSSGTITSGSTVGY